MNFVVHKFIMVLLINGCKQCKDVYAYTKYFTIDEIAQLLNDNGFKVDEIERRKTQSENELAGGELVVYATNQRVKE